jgi:Zn-finger nucleic acid-binding protein
MSEVSRLCPGCRTSMSPHDVRSLRLDICGACGGVWFDAGEFGRVSRLGSRAVDEVVAQEPPELSRAPNSVDSEPCPLCTVQLNRYHFAGSSPIMLAGCPQCAGIFLSHEDLLKLDVRDQQLENRGGQHLNEAEAGSIAALQGQLMYDRYSSSLAQYNWEQLLNPVLFS